MPVVGWGASSSRLRSRRSTVPGGIPGDTDWATLLDLHRALHRVAPSLGSGVALAAVVAEVDGPAAGLAALDALEDQGGQAAQRFQPARATRAHLLDRLGRGAQAAAAYDHAIAAVCGRIPADL